MREAEMLDAKVQIPQGKGRCPGSELALGSDLRRWLWGVPWE